MNQIPPVKDEIIKKWQQNFEENYKSGIFNSQRSRPFNFIVNNNKYHGKPVILVGAGPSLDKNIDILKNYQNSCIIICADVALSVLLDKNIKPDFVVSIDPSKILALHLEDYDTTDLMYICPTTVSPEVLKVWRGKILFFNQTEHKLSHKYSALKKLEMPGWTTFMNNFFVGATMYQVASSLGALIVGLVGYDLALTDKKQYCTGVLEKRIPKLFGIALGTQEYEDKVKELFDKVFEDKMYYEHNKTKIYTTTSMSVYKYAFYTLVAKCGTPVINCTGGGSLHEIMTMPLDDFGKRFCTNAIQKTNDFTLVKRKKRR